MNWSNVRHILYREVRDQLRDRRTLFMIFVLPLLLYPLLGMSMLQVAQFVREQPTRILLIGRDHLPKTPPLIEDDHFAPRLFDNADKVTLLELHFPDAATEAVDETALGAIARQSVEQGAYEAVVQVPADFRQRLDEFRQNLGRPSQEDNKTSRVPSPRIFYSTAKEKSQLAYIRVSKVLDRWMDEIGRENLASRDVPENVMTPFTVSEEDVADATHRDAAIWSKVLPFLLLIWALTGAFYPAVDLCAGEKERGTLETLLSSPAERSEIVWGKLLTVMLFSVGTAVLNILSMGLTGTAVITQLPGFGPPPLLAPLWLFLALLPVSALFSALCLALAAFARSTKEGQYYLMPLVLITMPLVILPMAPGVELSLGNSLIPLTGVVLLLRAMLEGNYLQALPYIIPVAGVTIGCCLLAIRWAVDQFNSESVLFREGERINVSLWVRHLMRDRDYTPTPAMGLFCGILILLLQFFMSFALPMPQTFNDLAVLALFTQLVVIATPVLLMTIMLTRSPRKTLLFNMPPLLTIPAAVGLAVFAHPLWNWLAMGVKKLYPISGDMHARLGELIGEAPNVWVLLLIIAVAPAIFEELGFRGFILSGMRHVGHKWWAIVVSSLFFAFTHGILQQSLVAAVVGMLIGYLAIQTGSIFPCMLYHMVHNGLGVLSMYVDQAMYDQYTQLQWLIESPGTEGLVFRWPAVVVGTLLAAGIVYWLYKLPYKRTPEEALQEALDHHGVQSPA